MIGKRTLLIAGLVLLAVSPVFPHHAEPLYDLKNPTTVKGMVTRVEWANPHVYLYLTVKNDKGESEAWSIELTSPGTLKHHGWTNNTVKPGDSVACTGGRAKSGAKTLRSLTVELPGGKKLKS